MPIASSSESAWITDSTGPKISSWAISMSAVTSARIVGPTNAPSGSAARRAAVDDHRRALLQPAVDPAQDPVARRGRDDRADIGAVGQPVANRQRLGARLQLLEQRPLRVADRDHHRPGHAALAGGAERAAQDVRDRAIDDRVRHHDHEVLRAAQRLHALAGGGRALVHVLRDLRGADERDGIDARVVKDAVDHVNRAVDQVDDAVRKPPGVVDQVEDQLLRQRHLLGRLEDERVAACDRERQEPEGHHRREVERHDRRADADRLADRLGVDRRRDVLENPALHRLRDGRCGLDHLDRAADLGTRVRQRLAHLAGHRPRQLVLVRLHHLAEAEQPARALDRRAAAPTGERVAGGGDGGVDIGRAGERHARKHLAGRRVGDVQRGRTRRRPAPSGRRCSCPAGGFRWWSRSARRSAPWVRGVSPRSQHQRPGDRSLTLCP